MLNAWLPGRKDRRPLLRKLFLITVILLIMLLVALLAPGTSGKVLPPPMNPRCVGSVPGARS